jgi:hypothetical protein
MLATGLPVEDDVAGEAAVNPEVAVGTAAGDGSVEIADEGFVRSNVATREHALFHAQDAAQIEVGGFLFELGLFLEAAVSPSFRIGLDDFWNDLFGPDWKVFGKAVLADAAGALVPLGICAGGALGLILRCGRVAGGVGLFRRLCGEEIGVIELLAFATEELPLEPFNLLSKDRDLILYLFIYATLSWPLRFFTFSRTKAAGL